VALLSLFSIRHLLIPYPYSLFAIRYSLVPYSPSAGPLFALHFHPSRVPIAPCYCPDHV